jgi:DNA recombination protein RmuC
MMNFTTDTLVIAAMAAGLAAATGLLLSLVWAVRTRRQLDRVQKQLRSREQDRQALAQARARLRQESHRKDLELSARDAAIAGLRERLQERTDELSGARSELEELGERYQVQSREHAGLQASWRERESRHSEQIALLNETRESLKKDFENLAHRIFEDKGKSFTATSSASLEALLQPFREQITGFQARVNEVHAESLKGNTALEAEIRKVLEIGLEMNTQAGNLASALKGDKKTTGNWGEAQLERTLELAGLQPGEHYETQASFRDEEGRRRLPDFVIKLPGDRQLIIDSKVSLVDYDRAIGAETEAEREEALTAHGQAVRRHIDELAAKDYSRLPGVVSPDFVLMFMPVEPAYIEALKHNRELFNHGYQQGVILVSHTTLMPILRTVANLWMIDRSNREAREISSRAGDIFNQVCLVAERLHRLGNSLKSAGNHYNDTVKALAGNRGLHGKVERFAQLASTASKDMPVLDPVHADIDTDRLQALAAPEEIESGVADQADEEPRLRTITSEPRGATEQ